MVAPACAGWLGTTGRSAAATVGALGSSRCPATTSTELGLPPSGAGTGRWDASRRSSGLAASNRAASAAVPDDDTSPGSVDGPAGAPQLNANSAARPQAPQPARACAPCRLPTVLPAPAAHPALSMAPGRRRVNVGARRTPRAVTGLVPEACRPARRSTDVTRQRTPLADGTNLSRPGRSRLMTRSMLTALVVLALAV